MKEQNTVDFLGQLLTVFLYFLRSLKLSDDDIRLRVSTILVERIGLVDVKRLDSFVVCLLSTLEKGVGFHECDDGSELEDEEEGKEEDDEKEGEEEDNEEDEE